MAIIIIKEKFLDDSNPDFNPQLALLADSAMRRGAKVEPLEMNVQFSRIDNERLSPTIANFVTSEPIFGEVLEYSIYRFIKVVDLNANLPNEIPENTYIDENEEEKVLTWQDVKNLETVDPIQDQDGNYYFNVTAHLNHRGLSLNEYNIADSALPLLTPDDILAIQEANQPEEL